MQEAGSVTRLLLFTGKMISEVTEKKKKRDQCR